MVPELLVSDIALSLAFYTDVLGFKKLFDRPEDGFAFLEREGAQLMLEQSVPSDARSWAAAPLARPFGRGLNLQITVSDVDQLHRDCLAAGAKLFLSLETKQYRVGARLIEVRQFIIQDPDGYLLRFSQPA